MTSQFDIGFPGLKIRECKYYDRHQEILYLLLEVLGFAINLSVDKFYLH